MHRIEIANGKILELAQGDITRETTDAIVNAANSSLMGGAGVDGAVHRGGGPVILEECKKIRHSQYPKGLPTGHAVATSAGNLPAKYVIHTVGPVWRGGGHGEAEHLTSAYRESFRVADELGVHSVAFPAISTGAYVFPLEQATRIAVSTLAQQLAGAKHVRLVKLVVFDSFSLKIYKNELERLPRSGNE
jgi:O-acetyl-ADP-ribose deacetylase (regulator of RNase III)